MVINGISTASIQSALLIDADNFHDSQQLRAIHSQFGQIAGKGFVCHAHGDFKVLYQDALKLVWQELGARLLPCLPLNKNTTDAGLIIDALVLHFQSGVRRFGIASGDADFAPLSLQLKELGCEVTCFARKPIAFDAMVSYYDRVVRFDVPPTPSRSARPVTLPSINPVSVPSSPKLDTPDKALGQDDAELAALPALVRVPKTTAAGAEPRQDSVKEAEAVRSILAAVPPWRPNTLMQLNQLGSPLRSAGVKTGNAPLHELFRRYPAYFTVLPLTGQAKKVRLERMP